MRLLIAFANLALAWSEVVDPSMVGWRMVDRFAGFRFEVKGPHVVQSGYHAAAVKKADELGCFGWIQDSERRTVVGEARCAKQVAKEFKAFLEVGHHTSEVSDVHIFDYPDTKIKLHFSHFKTLTPDRVTCFHDPPHQCMGDITRESDDYRRHGGDEL